MFDSTCMVSMASEVQKDYYLLYLRKQYKEIARNFVIFFKHAYYDTRSAISLYFNTPTIRAV